MMGKRFGIAVLVVMLGAVCLDIGGGLLDPGEFGIVATAEAVVGRPLTPVSVAASPGRPQGGVPSASIIVSVNAGSGGAKMPFVFPSRMGYQTPNIDRIARDGALFIDSYAQQSCTAGRASFILGQHPLRYSTDNGAETFSWPAGCTTLFHGEKGTCSSSSNTSKRACPSCGR
jgi:hypothetical protein